MTCLTEKGLFKNADGVHPFPFHGAGVKPGDVATLHGGVKADFRLSLLEKLTPGEEEEIAHGVFYCRSELLALLSFTSA